MGFRDPVNSLSGDQITPGTITGSVLQTAATGQRVVVTGFGAPAFLPYPEVGFFTGDPGETTQARIRAGVALAGAPPGSNPPGDAAFLELTPPGLPAGAGSSVTLYGKSRNGVSPALISVYAPKILLQGDVDVSGALEVHGATKTAALAATSLTVAGAPYARTRFFTVQRPTGAGTDVYPAPAATTLLGGTWVAAPAGDYVLHTTLALQGSGNIGGNLWVYAGGALISMANHRADVTTVVSTITNVHPFTWGGGSLAILVQHAMASGTATVFNNTTKAVLQYLGPRV